jgi:ketosteroid isomerase-like protein
VRRGSQACAGALPLVIAALFEAHLARSRWRTIPTPTQRSPAEAGRQSQTARWEDQQVPDDRRYELATEPNDLARFFVERGNAGDLDGVVALFEADAVVALPDGGSTRGHVEIRRKYAAVLSGKPRFSLGEQQPAMINGDIALTSTYFAGGGAAAEVARRQPDGTWLWMIDKGTIAGD